MIDFKLDIALFPNAIIDNKGVMLTPMLFSAVWEKSAVVSLFLSQKILSGRIRYMIDFRRDIRSLSLHGH